MEACKLINEIVSREGSPVFVFNTDSLKSRIAEIKKIIGDNISLCYSIKANPFVISDIVDLVDNLEVCSPGELDICSKIIPDKLDKIIYSGVSKTYENISDAYDAKVSVYTAESIIQVELLCKIAKEQGIVLPVLLRLNAGSQFGMSKEDVISVIHNRDSLYKDIEIVGIHYFAGTQRANKQFKKQIDELHMLKEFFEYIAKEENFVLRKLEYGPGLPVPIFANDNYEDTLAPLKELLGELKEVAKWAQLTIEMGRFIVTQCGYYVTKILETKQANNANYAIVDGGINHVNYIGQIMGMKVPVISHLSSDGKLIESSEEEWSICGSLCTTNDNLVRSLATGKMNVGDYLVFGNIGAYSVTEGLYMFLSRTMPKIITSDDNCNYIVRRDFTESSVLNTPK